MINKMKREAVTSTTIISAGYDPETKALELEFTDTRKIYHYLDVPEEVYVALMAAESKGQFFNFYIRDEYAFQQMR